MYAVFKAAGAKKIRKPSDVMSLPGDTENVSSSRNELKERLKKAHQEHYGRKQ